MPKKDFGNVQFEIEFDDTTWTEFAKGISKLHRDKDVKAVYESAAAHALKSVRKAIMSAAPVGNDPDPTKVNGDPRVRMSKSVEIKVVSYKSGVVWAGVGHSTKHVPHQFMVMDGTKRHDISAPGKKSLDPQDFLKSKPHDGDNFFGPSTIHPGSKPTKHIEKIVNDPQYAAALSKEFGNKAATVLEKKLHKQFMDALKK